MTVCYIPPYDGVTKVTAFKQGFPMLVGDPNRCKMENPDAMQFSFRCFETNWGGEQSARGAGDDTRNLANKMCTAGSWAIVFFPTW